jgi:hypothetical protein
MTFRILHVGERVLVGVARSLRRSDDAELPSVVKSLIDDDQLLPLQVGEETRDVGVVDYRLELGEKA